MYTCRMAETIKVTIPKPSLFQVRLSYVDGATGDARYDVVDTVLSRTSRHKDFSEADVLSFMRGFLKEVREGFSSMPHFLDEACFELWRKEHRLTENQAMYALLSDTHKLGAKVRP
jgi:hypothetical protein